MRQGKVRAIGASTFPASEIVEAQWVAERRGLERFRTEQPPYSILARGIERDILPTCQRYGMGVLSWSPLAGLALRAYRKGQPTPTRRAARGARSLRPTAMPDNQRKLDAVEQLAQLAERPGCSLIHLAHGLRDRPPGASPSAIIGPRTMEQLDDLARRRRRHPDDDVLDRIDEIVPPGTDAGPHDAAYTPPASRA